MRALLLGVLVSAGVAWTGLQGWWPPTWMMRNPAAGAAVRWLASTELAALVRLPSQFDPVAPLTLTEPDSLFTRWKISRLEKAPAACQTWLAAVPDTVQAPLPQYAERSHLACGWETAIIISRLDGVRFSSPFTLSCGAAVALVRWQRHALQAAAREHLGSTVVRMDHLGSYACRNIGSGAQLSSHARANALDIAGFTLADGRHISVLRNWVTRAQATDAPEARFLRQAQGAACRSFNAVLGPDYNAAHRNHFHLDRGPARACQF